ncbi:MAG: thrombospondin type 3 repeat-containing protein, partial [Deltaproteobacteria bacterium]|nr:thrombospondin type 3 repeat-containing protein [Deltaproteobacteria bacterium]
MKHSITGASIAGLFIAVILGLSGCAEEDGVVGELPGGGGEGGSAGAGGASADDGDGDGVPDDEDNCPEQANPTQADTDGDGEGDACEDQDGTPEHPFIIPGDPSLPDYWDEQDTGEALSDAFDSYPGYEEIDESGPEYVYIMAVDQVTSVRAALTQPEPDGTDIDVHLLSGLDPLALIGRGNHVVEAIIDPGLYYFTLDTFVSGGVDHAGPYELSVALEAWHAGTTDDPLLPGEHPTDPLSLPLSYHDQRDTHDATSDTLDTYPGYEQIDESGPEFVYRFTIDEPARLAATIAFDEPSGTDIDLHLLSSVTPVELITRGNTALYAVLEPGTYFLVADTYVDGATAMMG